MGWLAVPRDWLGSLGDIARFSGRVMGIVYSGRVLRFYVRLNPGEDRALYAASTHPAAPAWPLTDNPEMSR